MKRNRAFTLIELLIAGLIAIIIGTGVLTVATRAWQNYDALMNQNLMQQEARSALDMVCDHIRNLSPWTGSIMAYSSANGTTFGYNTNEIVFQKSAQAIYRIGGTDVTGSISNISDLTLTYEGRVSGSDGALHWASFTVQNGNGNIDPRIAAVKTVHVSVTASRAGINGVIYACTLTSEVSVRNNFSELAPPSS